MQEVEALGVELPRQDDDPGHVRFRARQAAGEAELDRIGPERDDRDGPGGPRRGRKRGVPDGEDRIWLQGDELAG